MRARDPDTAERRVGGDAHDPASAALLQQWADRLHAEERAAEIRREHVVPLLHADRKQITDHSSCRAVHEPPRLAEISK